MNNHCIISVKDILENDNPKLIESFAKSNNIEIKENEKNDFLDLLNQLVSAGLNGTKLFGYYFNFLCQNYMQEEFDLIRYSNESIVNIEVKSTMPEKGITNQLQRHYHLLSTLGKKVHCVTYIADTKDLYYFDSVPKKIEFSYLISIIEDNFIDCNLLGQADLAQLLISPYSQPEDFSNHRYFLTDQQDSIKKQIISSTKKHICLCGKAGSGKSLLLFDIAKNLKAEGKSVHMYFCANSIENDLVSQKTGIDVETMRSFNIISANQYDVLFFDEAQRLRSDQLNLILSSCNVRKIIYSFDQDQTLHPNERKLNAKEIIAQRKDSEQYNLSKRVRVNASIEAFGKRMIYLNCPKWNALDFSCIKATYLDDDDSCLRYCRELKHAGKTIIELTPYLTKKSFIYKMKKKTDLSKEAHSVIGQEYDHVAVIVNKHILYKTYNDGKTLLSFDNYEYYPYLIHHSFWEAMSRAKKTLEIIVVNNINIYNAVCDILSTDPSRKKHS